MLPKIVEPSGSFIRIVGDLAGDVISIGAMFFPATLLDDKTATRSTLTCIAYRLLGPPHRPGHQWSQRSARYRGQ